MEERIDPGKNNVSEEADASEGNQLVEDFTEAVRQGLIDLRDVYTKEEIERLFSRKAYPQLFEDMDRCPNDTVTGRAYLRKKLDELRQAGKLSARSS